MTLLSIYIYDLTIKRANTYEFRNEKQQFFLKEVTRLTFGFTRKLVCNNPQDFAYFWQSCKEIEGKLHTNKNFSTKNATAV